MPYFFVKEFMKVPKKYMKTILNQFHRNKTTIYKQNENKVEKCCIIKSTKERKAK